MSYQNNLVRFVKRPEGRPAPSIFRLEKEQVPAMGEGEFLLRNAYLAMDPALVSRMRDEENYAGQVNPGDVMQAYGVGQVIETNNADVKLGEIRLGQVNMQEYTLSRDAEDFPVLNLGLAKPTWFLGAVGSTGATAYFSLLGIGKPQRGETVLVSAGGSSVGSIAAQIAKNLGCTTVAIVSTDEKAQTVINEWRYDAAVSYRGKSIAQLSADIAKACPAGVDVYYDNTSGDISEAVLDHYNLNARSIVIGRLGISHLNNTRDDIGRRENNTILTKRVLKQGFVLLDYKNKFKGAFIQLARWVKDGDIKHREDIAEGIDSAPAAFFAMLDGSAKGKQLVKLAELDDKLDPAPRWLGRLFISQYFPTRWFARKLTGGI
ncbi:MAG: NADP-dependent oxidoreductase [Pseudomonadota bacterium]